MTIINWSNEDNAERPNNFHSEDYVILNVSVKDCFKHMHYSMVLDLDSENGGDNAIGNRLERAKEHLLSGNPMDYPEIGANDRNDVIDFTNGRHRSMAAYKLGEEFIPMFVYKPTLDKFKRLVETKPLDNDINNFLNSKNKKPVSNKLKQAAFKNK